MCDTLAVVGARGLLFGKNSDRPPDEPQVVERFAARPAGGTLRTQYLALPDAGAAAFVGSRPTWLWGVEHGVNEHGVAIGNEKLYTTGRPKDRSPALLGMDLVRLGLERGRTADDAVEAMTRLIEAHGQGGSGERDTDSPYDSSFLVADASGGWIVETCDRTWAARPIGAGASVSNRISLGTDWTRASPDVAPGSDFQQYRHPGIPTTIADHRLAATARCVARGAATLTDDAVIAALRDHGTGPWGGADSPTAVPPPVDAGPDHRGVTVCMHVVGMQNTTASMVVEVPRRGDPTAIRIRAALGNPCVSVYVPVAFDDAVPAVLGDEAVWWRFARLRDRVEADPVSISEIRDTLMPVEDALAAGDTDPSDLDAALTALGV
jgi:secernin